MKKVFALVLALTLCLELSAPAVADEDMGGPGQVNPVSYGGFSNVKEDEWYAEAVLWAVEQGITNGTGDGSTFSPETVCDRGSVVTFLYRAFAESYSLDSKRGSPPFLMIAGSPF